MIDISDGLSSEVMHICSQSKVGCKIYEDKLPLDPQVISTSEEFNMDSTMIALSGGEDYELLFTVPIADFEKIKAKSKFLNYWTCCCRKSRNEFSNTRKSRDRIESTRLECSKRRITLKNR